jgi:hypothetical protein
MELMTQLKPFAHAASGLSIQSSLSWAIQGSIWAKIGLYVGDSAAPSFR